MLKSPAWLPLLLALLVFAGCNRRSAPTLDKSLAQQSLATFLDGWKSGLSADALKSRSPAIYVNDSDFLVLRKLADYRVIDQEKEEGGSLLAEVEITLDVPRGKVKQKRQYTVATGDVVGIFQVMAE